MSSSGLLKALLVIGVAFVGTSAVAQAPAQDPALALAAQDSKLPWGACPPFMPAGCALAVLHGDPAKPDADAFLKVPAGSVIPEHWHTSSERMVMVAGEFAVRYRGQEKVALEPGMYAYGPAKLPHSATCVSKTPCVLFIAFDSPVDAFPTAAPGK